MSDTTLEEARRCPRCEQPGQERMMRPAPPPAVGVLHFFACENQRCEWFDEVWPVQTRPDGTVVQPDDNRGDKRYRPMSNDMISRGQRIVEDAVGRDLRDSNEI